MSEPIHANYNIRTDGDRIVIDYKKSPREWFHFLYYGVPGALLVGIPLRVLFSIKHFSSTTDAIWVIGFLGVVMVWGLFKIVVACEILFLPTTALLTIDKQEKTITAKLIFFRKAVFTFDSIKLIQLWGHDSTVENYHEGRTFKGRLYFHQLQFLMKDGRVRKIHKFLSGKVWIPTRHKETTEVKNIAKYISRFIEAETGIKYVWLGTKKGLNK
ncbi:MAG TPA: hypothetical protein VGK59_09650 [Ohtaekwangia sp.]